MITYLNYQIFINVIKIPGISCLLFILFAAKNPGAADAQSTAGARTFALGQAGVALQDDPWALFQNPALMKTDQRSVSFYVMRYAGLQELTDLSATITIPASAGIFGAGVIRYGFKLFQETTLNLAYRYNFGSFSFGLKGSGYHVKIARGYGSAWAIGLSVGLAFMIGDKLVIGSRIRNINHPAYNNTGEELTRELAAGLSYSPISSVRILTEKSKDVRFPISVRSGIEIRIFNSFYFRSGFTTGPQTWALGFGFQSGLILINIAIQRHEVLGISPAMDSGLQF